VKTITDFAAAINSRDVETIAALMSDDHRFIDAHGFPDYYIGIEKILSEGDLAAAFGYAGAGTGEGTWKLAAAWRAIIRDGKSNYARCTLIQRFNSKE
jgi:hypothetical protein